MKNKIMSLISVVYITMIAVLTTGCGEKIDPMSQRVIDEINNLGEITIDDASQIEKIKADYSELTDSQKDQVTNYIDVVNAEDTIVQLRQELATREPEATIIEACQEIKNNLKNPDSLQITSIRYSDVVDALDYGGLTSFDTRIIIIAYSGENSMGGVTCDTAYGRMFTDGYGYNGKPGMFTGAASDLAYENMGLKAISDGIMHDYNDIDLIMSFLK